jgi:uncharacterized phage protein gp47/JayE
MAYEDMTYEVILQRMIDRVSNDYPNLDTREGSIIFNALAPAALEMAIMYTELDNSINESFVNTASREYILLSCEQMGMNTSIFEASSGTHKGEFDAEVNIGSRWNYDLYNYEVIEYIGKEDGYYTYKLLCETVGTAPNIVVGDLTPITEIPNGLSHAKLVECLIEGEDETDDEEIRKSYYAYVNNTRTDGNVLQYKQWCDEYEGIGTSKIFPLWNGANTVKVSILTTSNQVATQELVDEFQEYLDPGVKGMGDGVAPIGAFVTVSTATEKKLNISANITMKYGYTDTTPIDTALTDYLSSLAYDKSIVAYMNIGAIILAVDGVETISNLKINGGTSDVTLGDEEIAVLGTTDWVV